ncbi:MAG: PIG-L family deacetylase [Clostridiales bacterium]|jgi:LmbE family N-acetylglucosaminyl deacetylase|nr:PIG-L family deacetylase [Clostridiales bacterium]
MKFTKSDAELYMPDGGSEGAAFAATTHMAVSAHQDDIEFMAYSGIEECFGQTGKGFAAVVATNGSGSPRAGVYAGFTDAQMMEVRRREQKTAADIGRYKSLSLLMYPSSEIKDRNNPGPVSDLIGLFKAAKPKVVYTHNLADKHDTHVAVALRAVAALRALPAKDRPQKVYGCEVWRSLDWLGDDEKVMLDCAGRLNLAAALMGVFDSQISGGKRYDTAVFGRRSANATFAADHDVDAYTQVTYAMDLTPLVEDDKLCPIEFALRKIDAFRADAASRLGRF